MNRGMSKPTNDAGRNVKLSLKDVRRAKGGVAVTSGVKAGIFIKFIK